MNTLPTHKASNVPANRCRVQSGFTLVELLVVISIIALLVGISVPVALKVLGDTDNAKTRSQLQTLDAALTEYRLETGEVPDHMENLNSPTKLVVIGDDEDTTSDDTTDRTIALFAMRAIQLGGTTEALINTAARGQRYFDDNGTAIVPDSSKFGKPSAQGGIPIGDWFDLANWQIVDAWDQKLRYVKLVNHNDSFPDDDFLPASSNPYFASAGPDGLWGDAQELEKQVRGESFDETLSQPAEDNLYSFDLE